MTSALREALLAQYAAHKSWGAQLHRDNLAAMAEARPELRPAPSYATVRRFLAARGLTNLTVITADMNTFCPQAVFDRVVSVEMFEHMSNWQALLARATRVGARTFERSPAPRPSLRHCGATA